MFYGGPVALVERVMSILEIPNVTRLQRTSQPIRPQLEGIKVASSQRSALQCICL